jgi:uncharacterized membrane protein YhiD involved in acid resistance
MTLDQLGTHFSAMEMIRYFGPKLLFSIICGGMIGLERELKNKAAGIKTNILICIGSMIYTAISILLSMENSESGHYGDPARVAAQIVSGIGFLGGGTIIQARGTILGLTTAATIWLVAAIGICIGLGYGWLAVGISAIVVSVLIISKWFEDRILGRTLTFASEVVVVDPDGEVRQAINDALIAHDLVLDDFDIHATSKGETSILKMRYSGHREDQKKFVLSLWGTRGVREVRQI